MKDKLRYILDPKEVHGEDFPGETFRVLEEKETTMIMDQSNKTIRKRCIAVTFTGEQCRRTSKSDGPFCSMHLKNSPYISFRRQRLSRKEIVQLAETNGGTNGLDFTY